MFDSFLLVVLFSYIKLISSYLLVLYFCGNAGRQIKVLLVSLCMQPFIAFKHFQCRELGISHQFPGETE
uniref:Uncharacterized protein n=1 Tax=Arundo donax TaxID=35708 RepID=A0A0A9CYH2_ARUDO